MTEEEKKAIETMQSLINGEYGSVAVCEKKIIKIVLNLIEKQQKENERLKSIKIINNGKELFQNTLKEYNDLSEKEIKLQSISGYTIDNLINLFLKGYTLQENKVNIDDIYKAEYMQIPFDILTEENLDRLEKHCKKAIHYERGNIREEHEVILALLYKYQDSIPKEAIREKIRELEKQIEQIRQESRKLKNAKKEDYLLIGKEKAYKEILGE